MQTFHMLGLFAKSCVCVYVGAEETTMEQESGGAECEEEEAVCRLYNSLRTHLGR